MKQKTLCLLLMLVFAIFGIYAQTAVAPSSGSGTISDPYQIATWENLFWISAAADNAVYTTRMSYHYILTADIDLSTASPAIATWNSNTGWTPIGKMYFEFKGSFDGNNHVINGLYINRTQAVQGLFGQVRTPYAIKNLTLTNATIHRIIDGQNASAGSDIGILAGVMDDGLIENCHVQGSIFGTYNLGGLVGLINTGTNPAGTSRTIRRCSANVEISSLHNSPNAGGLIGSCNRATVTESFSTGNLFPGATGASETSYMGGFAGNISFSTVLDCYSRVDVTRTAGNLYVIGGFVGAMVNSSLQRCYSTGKIRDASNNLVGTNNGFVASIIYYSWAENAANFKMLNNFWDAQVSGISGTVSNTTNGSEAPIARNTHLMNSMKTFTDKSWDFRGETTNGTNNIWNIGNGRNDNYPYLNWQHPSDPDPVVTAAINPNPANGATAVLTNAQLSWETGIIAAPWGYKINFGTNTPPTNILQNHNNGTALTYNPGELDLAQTYYWQIVPYNALDAQGCPIWSFTTTAVAAPGVPVATAATDNTTSSFKANWNAAANAEGYYLDIAYDPNFTSFYTGYNNRNVGNVTSFDVTGLPNGVGLQYRVRAYNSGGTSANSNTITAYTKPGTTTLSMPLDGTTLADESGNLIGSLPNYQNAAYFKLWLGTNNPPTNVYNGQTIEALFYNMSGVWVYYFAPLLSSLNLSPGTTYYWRAEAVNPAGSGASSETRSFTTSGSAAPGNATLVSPANAALDIPISGNLSWNAPATGSAPTGYRIYLGLDNPPVSYETVATASGFQYNDLQYNRTYYWQALPFNGSNFASEQDIWSFTTVDYYQTALDPVNPGSGEIIPEILFPDLDGTFPNPTISTDWAPEEISLPNVGLYIKVSDTSLSGRKIVINPGLGFVPAQFAWRLLPNESWMLESRVVSGDPWRADYVYFTLPPAKSGDDVEIVFPQSEDQTLPVALSVFNAAFNAANYVLLQWVVQSETAHAGYNILRAEQENLGNAYRINTGLISQGNPLGTQISYNYQDDEVYPNSIYYYWLESISIYGTVEYYGPVLVSTTDGNDPGAPQIPNITGFTKLYPNPFNPQLYIGYGLKEASAVSINIYNSRGQLIRSFDMASQTAGHHLQIWDGKDQSGSACSSGIYHIRMISPKEVFSRKVMLVK